MLKLGERNIETGITECWKYPVLLQQQRAAAHTSERLAEAGRACGTWWPAELHAPASGSRRRRPRLWRLAELHTWASGSRSWLPLPWWRRKPGAAAREQGWWRMVGCGSSTGGCGDTGSWVLVHESETVEGGGRREAKFYILVQRLRWHRMNRFILATGLCRFKRRSRFIFLHRFNGILRGCPLCCMNQFTGKDARCI